MRCLCCSKILESDNKTGWHQSCVRRFFGTKDFPEIMIDDEALEKLTNESTNKGYTVPGVQKKLSLHLHSEHGSAPRLTLVNYPTGYILKPQVKEYQKLPELEYLSMLMAKKTGISVVPNALIRSKEQYAYITRRIDRMIEKEKIGILAMEDFCQLDYRLTEDKYRGSYERCAKIIQRYSSRQGIDLTELYLRLLFSFVIGNSDMHLKNFSLLEQKEASQEYALSPAYDLLPVNIILKNDKDQFALTIGGKKRNIHRNDFLKFANSIGIEKKVAIRLIDKIIKNKDIYMQLSQSELLDEEYKETWMKLICERVQVLENV